MAQIQITFQDDNVNGKAVKIIGFAGQLDETNVDSEAKKIYQVIEEMAEPNIILDFTSLEYMNSKSIGYVTDWYSKIMAKNGKVVISSPAPNILDILKVVGITQIINIAENLEAAKAELSQVSVAAAAPATADKPAAPAAEPTTPSQSSEAPPTA